MDLRLLRRPVFNLALGHSQFPSGNAAARRHESSYRRTKKKLNVHPDSSFLFSKLSPQLDHIIFNPPSSSPSVFDTPPIFLPKDDKRRKHLDSAPASTSATSNTQLPPLLRPLPTYQRHHLTEEDVAEIRRLRSTDPENWTRAKLARKYNCSSRFVGMCCEATPEKLATEKAKLEATIARWGPKRRKAREDRARRRKAVFRDE